jgi:hypothetical protein
LLASQHAVNVWLHVLVIADGYAALKVLNAANACDAVPLPQACVCAKGEQTHQLAVLGRQRRIAKALYGT